MSELILITSAILIILIVVGILTILLIWKKKKEGEYQEPDYRIFFILGICFLPIGIVFMTTVSPAFIGFFGLGVIYMIIGLANRDKWEKK